MFTLSHDIMRPTHDSKDEEAAAGASERLQRPHPAAGGRGGKGSLRDSILLALVLACALAALLVSTSRRRPARAFAACLTARSLNSSDGPASLTSSSSSPSAQLDDRTAAAGFRLGASVPPLPPLPPPLRQQIKEDLAPWRKGGVTLRHVEQAYCGSFNDGLRLQVIGGKLYIAGLTRGWESRMLGICRLLFRVHRVLGPLPDLDLVLEQPDLPSVTPTSTECPERGPLFQHYKALAADGSTLPDARHIVLIPDWSFLDWMEGTLLLYEEEWELLRLAAKARPWERRSNDIFFKGQTSNPFRGKLRDSMAEWKQAAAAPGGNATADLLLLALQVEIGEGLRYEPFPNHCNHKVLLHIAGLGNAGRYKYLLACGSPVVAYDLPGHLYKEFWFGLLENGTNVLTLPWDEFRDPAEHLFEATQRLLADEPLARRLGDGAAKLFREGLHPRVPLLYWRTLLEEYASMLRFKPKLHPDAVPIEQVLGEMARVTKVHSERTCSMCPGRPP